MTKMLRSETERKMQTLTFKIYFEFALLRVNEWGCNVEESNVSRSKVGRSKRLVCKCANVRQRFKFDKLDKYIIGFY